MASANPLFALLVRLAPGLLLLQTAPAQSFGPQQALTPPSANGANSVYSADLDGDGDADLLSASGGFVHLARGGGFALNCPPNGPQGQKRRGRRGRQPLLLCVAGAGFDPATSGL